jgi:phosphoribosylglycinamide formyltransferase-1
VTAGIGVLVSGSGSNLQAILDAEKAGALSAEVRVVISNVAGVRALERAQAAGKPAITLPHKGYPSREAYDDALVQTLREHRVEIVALAGFMRLVSARLLEAFPQRVVNIHPSLLPAFPGMHAQRQAIEHGAKVSGCTVHLVDSGLDSGPILGQIAVPVLEGDDEAALRERILAKEHELYPACLRALAEGRVRVQGRRVVIGSPA